MPRHATIARLDWEAIGRIVTEAAAETLAEAARRRAGTTEAQAVTVSAQDDRAMITLTDPALIRRETGDETTPPRPFLAPRTADLHAARAAILDRLHKETQ